jgi:hypothetical protein
MECMGRGPERFNGLFCRCVWIEAIGMENDSARLYRILMKVYCKLTRGVLKINT